MTDRLGPAVSPSKFADPDSPSDRRSSPRIHCHTVVTAVAPQGAGSVQPMQVLKAYSEDVSVGGARLISNEPIAANRLFLRFLLPTFGDRYVEAEIVSETRRERQWLTGKTTTSYVYGVRFTGVMADDALKRSIAALPTDEC